MIKAGERGGERIGEVEREGGREKRRKWENGVKKWKVGKRPER